MHGSAVVFPAVLAFAQHKALSGLDLLKSFVVGLEIEFAVAKAFQIVFMIKAGDNFNFGSIGSAAGVASLANTNTREIQMLLHCNFWC